MQHLLECLLVILILRQAVWRNSEYKCRKEDECTESSPGAFTEGNGSTFDQCSSSLSVTSERLVMSRAVIAGIDVQQDA